MASQISQHIALDVLLIEDSRSDAELTVRRLQEAGFDCSVRCVVSEQQLRSALAARLPDLILSDFSLPGFDGMSALAVARAEAPGVPFIFLSGTIGEERAIEALKSGAIDYVLKGNPKRLVPAIKRALADAELRRTSQLAEKRVARLTGVLQMLSGINAAVVRIQNRDDLLSEACRLAHRVGGYAIAMVALINPMTRMARAVGWAGYDFLPHPDEEFPVADRESADTSMLGRVMRTGQAALCEDINRPPFVIDGREALLAAGVRSLACLPLRVDGTPVGSFLCGTVMTGAIGADEMLLLEEVASNLSFALQYLDKQDAVRFLSYFEPLTGLARRALFCERLNSLLKRGSGSLPRLAVTVFDIEHLSVINDSFGRHTGDRLLQCVADRLKAHFPDTEQLAHLGGGTFLSMNALSEHAEDEIRTLNSDFTRIFDRPFSVEGREIQVKVKSGLACYPDDGEEPNTLVQNAEAALKEAKTSGEQYLHHRIEMNSDLARRVAMEHRLRRALEDGQFALHYQPKLSLLTGKICGAEALLRWQDPENGLTAPGIFLPLLESAGLMPAIGAWVLRRAAADCRDWRRRGLPAMRIAVNISPPELRRRNIAREILDGIGDLVGEPHRGIDIEVTEGALAGDSSSCVHALRLLRSAGVRIAIDDFGTGFSSLGRLSELPIDMLKIDRSFTMRLPEDHKRCTLVSTIIGLAHAFDMITVAEGVETQAQLDYLIRERCDESQGYLHGRPVPKVEFERQMLGNPPARAAGAAAEHGADGRDAVARRTAGDPLAPRS
ncbi:MAG TPA: EAL domain-containing protein [Steroidobacteraceae bacterium]|nr:EAL domain-containing protein [Steroidobacteraceae bacterium]